MTSTSQIPPRAAPSGWGLVDEGLQRLEQLAAVPQSEEEFCEEVCQQVLLWGMPGVAIWTVTGGKVLKLVCQKSGEGLAEEVLAEQSPATLSAALDKRASEASGSSVVRLPVQGQESILVPWQQAEALLGVLQLVLPPDNATNSRQGYAQLGNAIGELLALFHSHHSRRDWQQKCEDLQRWQTLLRTLHSSFDLQHTAYHVAHDGRAILQCDRLSVVVRKGTGYRVAAVSGAEFVHRRAEVVTAMQRLSALVAATGEPFWCDADTKDLPPQLAEGIADYLEASPANRLGLIPLAQQEPPAADADDTSDEVRNATGNFPPFALLVIEQFTAAVDATLPRQATHLAETICAPLRQAWQLQSVPLLKFWLAWQRRTTRWRWLSRGAFVAAALLIVIGLLTFIPAEVKLRAPGELQPTTRHEVFAPCDSVVTDVLVDHGQQVDTNAPLLQLRAVDLDLETQRVAGELETLRKQLAAVQAERLQTRLGDAEGRQRQQRLTADEEQFQEQIMGLETRQKLLAEQREELQVRSPASGSIITWNARERLTQRPLRRGDLLLTVADEAGPWQVELKLPARQAGRLFAAIDPKSDQGKVAPLPVSLALSNSPGTVVPGTVREVAQRVDVDETGSSYVLIVVDVPADQLPQRTVGAVVYGRIEVGQSSLGVAWFHEVIDAAKLWFTW